MKFRMSKHKHKTKIVYREHREQEDTGSIKKEIEELNAKKQALAASQGPGFWAKAKGFIANMGINRQINTRQQYLGAKRQIASTKTQIQLREAQEKLKELNKKRSISFEGLTTESPKKLSWKDIAGDF